MSNYPNYEPHRNGRYKYRLQKDYSINLPSLCEGNANLAYIQLRNCILTIKAPYAWDGPSGPAPDTVDFQRASLVHDALYQLIRERELPYRFRKKADILLYKIALEDYMPHWYAIASYISVRLFGWRHTMRRKWRG